MALNRAPRFLAICALLGAPSLILFGTGLGLSGAKMINYFSLITYVIFTLPFADPLLNFNIKVNPKRIINITAAKAIRSVISMFVNQIIIYYTKYLFDVILPKLTSKYD